VLYLTGVYIAGVLLLRSPVAVPAMWVVVSAPEMCCLGRNVVSLWGRTYSRSNKMSSNSADTAGLYLLMFIHQRPALFSANVVLE
jgi:hypothetical protein